jgi:RNA polymerase sigma-70 factor (ECF subfamily)
MLAQEDLLTLLHRKDPEARKQAFHDHYGRLAAISQRYCKNHEQALEALLSGFTNCLSALSQHRHPKITNLTAFLEKEFIQQCILFVKSIRNEYYVSSTVHASETAPRNYNLFENNELIDFNNVDTQVLISSLQQLVPSQRLIFNLHVIDGFSLAEASALLESSEATVKSNLEKARYNLQKNIEKNLRTVKA